MPDYAPDSLLNQMLKAWDADDAETCLAASKKLLAGLPFVVPTLLIESESGRKKILTTLCQAVREISRTSILEKGAAEELSRSKQC